MWQAMLKHTTGNRCRNLSLISLCVGSMCIGLTLGWPESSLSYFLLTHCDDGHKCYDGSADGSATIQMIMNFGSCLGALIPSCFVDAYGRKSTFFIAGIFNLAFWLILVSFQAYLEIILGAVLGGFAAGIYVTTTALYVSEISLPQSRGAIGALSAFCAYVGVLFGNCLVFVTYTRILALIMACFALTFVITIPLWMVESPYYFFLRGKTLETKLSLKALRGATSVLNIDAEYRAIELFFQMTSTNPSSNRGCGFRHRLTISQKSKHVILFLCITQMIGAYGMADYSKSFLNILLPNYGRIVIAAIDVFSVGIGLFMIETFGRRSILLAISIVGSSIACLVLAIFTLTEYSKVDSQEATERSMLLPGSIIALYYTVYSLGLTPIMPIITGEIFPSRDKTIVLSFCISFIYFSSIIIQSTFEILNAKQGSNFAFASFAIVGSLGIPVVFIFLPESNVKPLNEIQYELQDFTILIS